jgi:hypothetical protein
MERHTRHRGAVLYGLLNMWSAVAVSELKRSIVGCNSGFLLESGGSMAAHNHSGSLFFKCRTQTTRFKHGLGSVFLSASFFFGSLLLRHSILGTSFLLHGPTCLFYTPACLPASREPALMDSMGERALILVISLYKLS